jgi:pyruvate/oxaloacetate carboxyltransferase
MAVQFANEGFSTRKSAWTSGPLGFPAVNTPASQFVFIQTTRAVYSRAKVINESPNGVTIEYVCTKSDAGQSKGEKRVESLKRSEIVVLRNYVD